MMQVHKAIYEKEIRQKFDSIVKDYLFKELDYIAFSRHIDNSKELTYLMSNLEWQKMYDENKFSIMDPVRIAASTLSTNVARFELMETQDSFSLEIMRQREKHQIYNGIVILKNEDGKKYQLTLASSYKNLDTMEYVAKNFKEIDYMFHDLKKLFKTDVL
ncbi:MAG: hypothetical protein J0H68_09810 [Sphingobacteriia bacterium]|nr:hypothetical protein [Sphingobacteriia bacterium]